jgi:hypothetical protein
MGKRSKDKAFYELHETLSELSYLLEDFIEALSIDLAAEEETGLGGDRILILTQKHDTAEALLNLIEDNLWPRMIRLASTSSSISHRRAGDFF